MQKHKHFASALGVAEIKEGPILFVLSCAVCHKRYTKAELMGYGPSEASHFLADYRRVTRRARGVVERVFWGL